MAETTVSEASRTRAAQYVRMSTEHQNYSIECQSVANAAYAIERDLEIVRTYTDAGISGVRLAKREGLKALLADILNGAADYSVVLVYDVSRWGRFQDPDESAHYEFICRTAGVPIVYTAEPFASDGSITATLVKQLKRAMAAEYSRELSDKVARAKRGLAKKGFYSGGVSSYAFRRQVIAPDGTPGPILGHGQRKALLGHRIVLVAGPDAEVQIVRRIFREFAIHGLATSAIARGLNSEGVPSNQGLPWSRNRIYRVLTDEKYVGTIITGRKRSRLSEVQLEPQENWIRLVGACPALVDRRVFDIAQANIRRSEQRPKPETLLADLRRAFARCGSLTGNIIRAECTYTPGYYTKRFGSLRVAYELVGYTPTSRQLSSAMRYQPKLRALHPFGLSDQGLIDGLKRLYEAHGRVSRPLIDADPELPSSTTCCKRLGDMMQLCRLAGYTPSRRQVSLHRAGQRRRESAFASSVAPGF